MTTYECNKCGMSVNATCGKYNEKLLNDTLVIENGSVQIAECLNGQGKMKSTLYREKDIACTL